VPGSLKLADVLARARSSFRSAAPEQAIPALLQARDELDRMADNPWKSVKRAELDGVIVACAGLFAEVTATTPSVPQGGTISWTASLIARRPMAIALKSVELPGQQLVVGKAMTEGAPLEVSGKLTISSDAPLSNPYWHDLPPEPGRYPVRDASMIGMPEGPAPLEAELTLVVDGHAIQLRRALAYKWTDPVAGERYRSVEVLPAVTLDLDAHVLLFPDATARELPVRVHAIAGATGAVQLETPDGFQAVPSSAAFKLEAGGQADLSFRVTPPAHASSGIVRAVAHLANDPRVYDRGLLRIEHGHIPIQTLLPRAELRATRVEIVRKRRKVGYLKGAGDEIPAALGQIGYQVVELEPKTLTAANLAGLDAIVTGVRAWNVEPRLTALHGVLMQWVARGGTLVAQYNTNNRIGPAPPELGPFPFTISQARTTDENATVTLAPDPVLTAPNKISAADFDGWIQERGLYFADTWDTRYRTPLSMSDPGEAPLKGALLIAKYKRGAFIYTGLALFRQLPAGVPGAYRLFANLIEYDGSR
jgi:hypothetical protein